MENTTPKTITIFAIESYSTTLFRESITLNVADYPELEGMSEDEIKEYILENASEMNPTNDEYYSDLREELLNQDVRREKITNEDNDVRFE
jgi:hypothetical protein